MTNEIVDTVIEKFTPLINREAKKSLYTGRVTTESRTQDSFVTSFPIRTRVPERLCRYRRNTLSIF